MTARDDLAKQGNLCFPNISSQKAFLSLVFPDPCHGHIFMGLLDDEICFPPDNLSYINLIIRPTKESRRKEGQIFSMLTQALILVSLYCLRVLIQVPKDLTIYQSIYHTNNLFFYLLFLNIEKIFLHILMLPW